jgi:hypothetical protein
LASKFVEVPVMRFPRVRLSVRALMALVLLFGFGLGRAAQRAGVQRDAVATITKAEGHVIYDHEMAWSENPWTMTLNPVWLQVSRPTRWLIDNLGVHYVASVNHVQLSQTSPVNPEVLEALSRLDRIEVMSSSTVLASQPRVDLRFIADKRRVRTLYLAGLRLEDGDLAHLRGLKILEELTLGGPGITDACLAHLEGLPKLKRLEFYKCRITNSGLTRLEKIHSLDHIKISSTQVTAPGAHRFQAQNPGISLNYDP